jgi:hypothetical protein
MPASGLPRGENGHTVKAETRAALREHVERQEGVMDDRVYYLAWAGVIAAVPLSAAGWWTVLPASVSDMTTASISSLWFLVCIWSVGFTFFEYGPRYEARERAERESYRTDEEED